MIEPGRVAYFDFGPHHGKYVVISQIVDFQRVMLLNHNWVIGSG